MGKLILILLIIVVILGGGYYFIATRSNDAIPGDTYYSFDRTHEGVMQIFTGSNSKIDFELDLLEERITELQSLFEKQAEFSILIEAVNEIVVQDDKTATRIREALDVDEGNATLLESQDKLDKFRVTGLDLMKQIAKQFDVSSKVHLKTADEIARQDQIAEIVENYKKQIE